AIIGLPFLPLSQGQLASRGLRPHGRGWLIHAAHAACFMIFVFAVTSQTATPIMGCPGGRPNFGVGVVTADPTKLFAGPALLKTLAYFHLLHVADRFLVVVGLAAIDKNRHELVQRQPWPEILQPAASPHNSNVALEMALLAHSLAKCRRQLAGVN